MEADSKISNVFLMYLSEDEVRRQLEHTASPDFQRQRADDPYWGALKSLSEKIPHTAKYL